MLLSLQQPPEAFFTDPLPQPRTLTPSPRRSLLPFLLPAAATLSPLCLADAASPPRRRPSPPPLLLLYAAASNSRGIQIASRLRSVRAASEGDLATARRSAAVGVSDRESGSGAGARRWKTRWKRRRKWSWPRQWKRRARFGSASGSEEARSASTNGDTATGEGVLPRGARRRSPGA